MRKPALVTYKVSRIVKFSLDSGIGRGVGIRCVSRVVGGASPAANGQFTHKPCTVVDGNDPSLRGCGEHLKTWRMANGQ